MKFNIVHYKREGFIHSIVFAEIILLLKYSLEDLGYDVSLSDNVPDKSRMNILVGFLSLEHIDNFKDCKTIYFQLEPLEHLRVNSILRPQLDIIEKWFSISDYIWDYNDKNLLEYSDTSNVAVVPIGFNSKMAVIPQIPVDQRPIDVLFYGVFTDKRNAIFEQFARSQLKFKHIYGVYGEERDTYIAHSKIILNIHKDDVTDILESTRLSYLLNNNQFILTETSQTVYPGIKLVECSADKLLEKAIELVNKPQIIDHVRTKNSIIFEKNYLMTTIINDVLIQLGLV